MDYKKQNGFTIVELLVVIVVIGILAAIAIVSYNGIARKAGEVSVKSDLRNASTQLELLATNNSTYPSGDGSDLPKSEGTTYQFTGSGNTYCLTATSSRYIDIVYSIDQNGALKEGACPGHNSGPPPVATNVACFAVSAGTITDYYVNESNDDANTACPRAVVIPNTIEGVTITSLGNQAFYANQITSIVIPNTVVSIGEAAFFNNLLDSVNIPSSLTTISANAFNRNQLTSINIPVSVTSIGVAAFYDNKLTSVVVPGSVTSIGSYAFQDNLLTSITVPVSVTSIGTQAFYSNPLTSVSIPTATTIGSNAFDEGVTIVRY